MKCHAPLPPPRDFAQFSPHCQKASLTTATFQPIPTVKPTELSARNRLYFMRLRRLTKQALLSGTFTPEREQAHGETVPTFTHFLDLPMFFLIVALGALKPETWALFAVGSVIALAIATVLTLYVPRLYPCEAKIRFDEQLSSTSSPLRSLRALLPPRHASKS